MPQSTTVTLGERVFPVVPQKHARLRHRLSADDFSKIMSAQYSRETYRLLCILIPAMDPNAKPNQATQAANGTNPGMPQYEFDGFTSQEAADADEYDEENDPSPTTDQIIGALETVVQVNGAGRLGKLMDLIQAGSRLAESNTSTQDSQDSPGENGVSTSIPSGTSPQTVIEN